MRAERPEIRTARRIPVLLAVLCLAGCSPKPSSDSETVGTAGETASDKGTATVGVVGVSLLTMANPFFKDMADAMVEEGKKQGFRVEITAGEMDAARQRDQVNDFIVKKVDAIILSPCDSKAVGTAITEANRAEIPVFTADIASLDPNAKVVTHIATDNYSGGKLAGRAMVAALGGKGTVAIIDHPEVESVILRTKGFREEVAKAKGIRIVAQLPGGGTRDLSYKTAQDILEKNPNLNGLFAINDPSALGAVAAIERSGKTGKIQVIGFDGMPEAKQAVKEGKIHADAIQYPDRIGRMAIQAVAKYRAGEDLPPETLIPTGLYTKKEADADPSLRAKQP